MKSMLKSELAEAAGVTRQTFYTWLQSDKEVLHAMGVGYNARLLPPVAVNYICNKYGIEI